MKKALRLFGATCAAAILCATAFAAPSESVYIWNGSTSFEEGSDYSVRTYLTLTENLVIPEGMTLYVRSDGCLTIPENVTLTVNGRLKVNSGATLRCYGAIEVNGSAEIFGETVIRENAVLESSSLLSVFSGGRLNVLGNVRLNEGSSSYITGSAFFRKSSSFSLGGRLEVAKGGALRLEGASNALPSSFLLNNGTLEIEETALALEGKLENNSLMDGSGSVKLSMFLDYDDNGECAVEIVPPDLRYEDGAAYVGEIVLVNRQYRLPEDYPVEELSDELMTALQKMRDDTGFTMGILSGFRSYQYQVQTYNHWKNLYGEKRANLISAPAGASEHQTGLAVDISSLNQSYINTAEGQWVAQNCHKYGFIVRFPENKVEYTGYSYEPWHLRYVGVELATRIYESGMCLEEFLGLPPDAQNY